MNASISTTQLDAAAKTAAKSARQKARREEKRAAAAAGTTWTPKPKADAVAADEHLNSPASGIKVVGTMEQRCEDCRGALTNGHCEACDGPAPGLEGQTFPGDTPASDGTGQTFPAEFPEDDAPKARRRRNGSTAVDLGSVVIDNGGDGFQLPEDDAEAEAAADLAGTVTCIDLTGAVRPVLGTPAKEIRSIGGFTIGDTVRGWAKGVISAFRRSPKGDILAVCDRPGGKQAVQPILNLQLLSGSPIPVVTEPEPLVDPVPAGEEPVVLAGPVRVPEATVLAIAEAYSADVLAEGRLRRPARLDGGVRWTCTCTGDASQGITTRGHRLYTVAGFAAEYPDTKTHTYAQTVWGGDAGSGYFGMTAKTGREVVVLGPAVEFLPDTAPAPKKARRAKAEDGAATTGPKPTREPKAARVVAIGDRVRYRAGGKVREGVVTAVAADRADIDLGGKIASRFLRELTVLK